jgi:DNA helicase-2/ATP-dependent DNA helicase PcrA
VNVIMGPPGTGKTTELMRIIERAIADGVDPGRIGFVSFTNAAVDEGRARAAKRFGLNEKAFPWFKTLHSAGKAIQRDYREPASDADMADFCKAAGYRGTGAADESSHAALLRRCMEFARSRCITFRDAAWLMQTGRQEVNHVEVERFAAGWREYLRAIDKIDYSDMLAGALGKPAPSLDLLAVDEAQDLSPLQQHLVAGMLAAAKVGYVVGDDDQAIHRWAGADARWIQGLAREHGYRVLSQSYRVPGRPHRLAQRVIRRVMGRLTKDYAPKGTEGSVTTTTDYASIYRDRPSDAAILVRSNRLCAEVARDLVARRVAFTNERAGVDPLADTAEHCAARAVRALQAGGRVTGGVLAAVAAMAHVASVPGVSRGALTRVRALSGDAALTVGDIEAVGALPLVEHVRNRGMAALSKVDADMVGYYDAVLDEQGKVNQPKITLTTAHSSKGREWDAVYLHASTSQWHQRLIEQGGPEADDEHRLAYVAVTRTRDRLTIIEPADGRAGRYPY